MHIVNLKSSSFQTFRSQDSFTLLKYSGPQKSFCSYGLYLPKSTILETKFKQKNLSIYYFKIALTKPLHVSFKDLFYCEK